MKIRGIRRSVLDLLLQLGADNHPQEFGALLREQDGIIEELDLLPGTIGRDDSVSLLLHMMPIDIHLAGSAHSHPNGVLRPSNADLSFFPRAGRYHFIIGYPYNKDNWRCFSASGEPLQMDVID
ncbi:MAG TPA: Mov34/MPN/PAD-1 family protein [Methanomicrobiales archaeon]|nr:Mov34/MPN/PAD-1 family protein [Methanomicrobiales archaeon]